MNLLIKYRLRNNPGWHYEKNVTFSSEFPWWRFNVYPGNYSGRFKNDTFSHIISHAYLLPENGLKKNTGINRENGIFCGNIYIIHNNSIHFKPIRRMPAPAYIYFKKPTTYLYDNFFVQLYGDKAPKYRSSKVFSSLNICNWCLNWNFNLNATIHVLSN